MRRKSLQERLYNLKRLRIGIECFEEQIYEALYRDLGKGRNEAYMTEIGFVYAAISHAEAHLHEWMKPERRATPFYLMPARSEVRYEPYGTVLIIGPFNYPFQLVMAPLVGALCAGNAVVVKPSEIASHTEKVIEAILMDAFREGDVRCVIGSADATEHLVRSGFDYIFFTGSAATGRKILAAAADTLTPVTLELGGKSPAIVCADANIALAAKRIVWGKTVNAGQTCIAPDYVLAAAEIKDALLKEMRKAVYAFFGENAAQSDDYGRIINQRHFGRLDAILRADAAYITSGGRMDKEHLYMEPAILDLSNAPDPLACASMQAELFGPILPVISYDTEEDVFALLHKGGAQLKNPLALYVFSRDRRKQNLLTERIPSGGVCINDTILHITGEHLPFGGVGASGMGAYHGKESFLTFSHKRGILMRSNHLAHDIIYPPYNAAKPGIIKKLMK